MSRLATWAVLAGLVGLFGSLTLADEPSEQVDFANDIRPIFAKYCTKCHGDAKRQAGLRLDNSRGISTGGDSGDAIVPGNAVESLLYRAISGDENVEQMPPEGASPDVDEIALIRRWIDAGAAVPNDEPQDESVTQHWAFRPPVRHPLPDVALLSWVRNPIDRFVLDRLEQENIGPSAEADRATVIRRLSLDLLGLPPTAADVDEFLADTRPDALEHLVDRLLASEHYGERWGRHWLDLARYADSNGYTRDFGREIWKYRDWVIRAVNADMPFDQFTIEQFAGDMLPDATLDQMIATGFHRNTLINEEGGTDPEQFRVDAVADRVDTTGEVFLGLTLGCARCHEHKYDPISQREYYQLFAFLNNCDEPTIDAPSSEQVASGLLEQREQIRANIQQCETELADQQEAFDAKQLEWEQSLSPEDRAKLPGPVQAALMAPLKDRKSDEAEGVAALYKKTDAAREAFPLVAEIQRLRASEPAIPTTMVMRNRAEPRETHIHKRGNFLDPGARVDPRVPAVLHNLSPDDEQPTRLDFARWLVDPANPLTPRVIVNRHWQRFFGRGIVETDNDFGTQGAPPTHPRLLDWLATEFIARGWSVKSLHRLIVTSATYRQSSLHRPELAEIDPQNRFLARQSRLRLDAEIIRDVALAASGLLSPKIGGPSVHPPQPEGVFDFTQDPKPWNVEAGEDRYRRGMYTYFWRSSPYPALMVFDFPNSNVTCTRRARSNTPLQALTLANDVVFVECAQSLAQKVLDGDPGDPGERMRTLFRGSLAREPSPAELGRLLTLLEKQRTAFEADANAAAAFAGRGENGEPKSSAVEAAAWTSVARVVLNLDEFITRE